MSNFKLVSTFVLALCILNEIDQPLFIVRIRVVFDFSLNPNSIMRVGNWILGILIWGAVLFADLFNVPDILKGIIVVV